jgi:hypothetical protein
VETTRPAGEQVQADFLAGDPDDRIGARVATATDGNEKADIVVTVGRRVAGYSVDSPAIAPPDFDFDYLAGVFVD